MSVNTYINLILPTTVSHEKILHLSLVKEKHELIKSRENKEEVDRESGTLKLTEPGT